jgi:hypothetical protein
MSSIPPDIYQVVHELTLAIVNATESGDDVSSATHCQALRNYYEEQIGLGRSHPFLTEAMADYTTDAAEAALLYELSLDQAHALSGEPTHTKMISLAGRLIELGRQEQAEAFLRDGRVEALRCNDTFWIGEADELSRGLAG